MRPLIARVRMSATASMSAMMPPEARFRKKRVRKLGRRPMNIEEVLTAGVMIEAKDEGSSLAKTSGILRSLVMVTSTIVEAIFSLLAGTIPYQPKRPKGCPGQVMRGMPVQLMG